MSTSPPTPTPAQVDYIQTAAAIIFVIDDRPLRSAMIAHQELTSDQLTAVTRRFEEGIARFKQDTKQHRIPDAPDVSKIAIVADHLSHAYPDGLTHSSPDLVKVGIADIRDAWGLLTSDISTLSGSREEWEGTVRATYLTGAATLVRPAVVDQSIHAARSIGMAIAHSIGVEAIFHNAFEAGEVPLATVDPLPQYAPTDPRSQDPAMMTQLQLTLSVTEGILGTLSPDEPGEDHEHHMVQWFRERASKALDKAKDLVVPAALSKLSDQLGDKEQILRESRDLLKTAIYGAEPQVAAAAADHAVERSIGTILFLSICPNVPFVIPTLELRLALTRPFSFITKAMHEALGWLPIVGFLFLLLRGLGQFLDAIPRAQVRFVQNTVTESWLANPNKRARIIKRYLRFVQRRADHPEIDAVERMLLSIVQ